MCTGVLVLGELGPVLHTHSVVAVGEIGVEMALRGVRLLTQEHPGTMSGVVGSYTQCLHCSGEMGL